MIEKLGPLSYVGKKVLTDFEEINQRYDWIGRRYQDPAAVVQMNNIKIRSIMPITGIPIIAQVADQIIARIVQTTHSQMTSINRMLLLYMRLE